MVTFTHLEPGTAEPVWRAAVRRQGVPPLDLDLSTFLRVVFVSAHPDDETLAAGGLMLRAAQSGTEVRIVMATLGERSHPDSPTHTREQLAGIRQEELAQAVGLLAPGAGVELLGLNDGSVAEGITGLADVIAAHCAPAAGKTLIVAPWRGDGHTDHEAAGEAAARAAADTGNRLLEYPVWMWHWADAAAPELPWAAMRRLDLSALDSDRKREAIACHLSQTTALSGSPGDEAVLPGHVLDHFRRPFEIFIDAAGAFAPTGDERTVWARSQFDAVHAGAAEPWAAPYSWYEERKRALTLAVLPRPVFAAGLEIGCSTGVLTAALAPRCTRLLGIDLSAEAVKTAAERTRDLAGVEIRRVAVPQQWPEGTYDLIVFSEIGYFLDPGGLRQTLHRAERSMTKDGILVACHWRHAIHGWPLDGMAVHEQLRTGGLFRPLGSYREEDFILEVFGTRRSAP